MIDLDEHFIAPYYRYDGLKGSNGYYTHSGLALDDKWKHVAIPVLAICARDDPITHCDALRPLEFSAANENLIYLVTETGGHVGWPMGNTPWERGFDFMNEAITHFCETIVTL